jgi:hypothetical protein
MPQVLTFFDGVADISSCCLALCDYKSSLAARCPGSLPHCFPRFSFSGRRRLHSHVSAQPRTRHVRRRSHGSRRLVSVSSFPLQDAFACPLVVVTIPLELFARMLAPCEGPQRRRQIPLGSMRSVGACMRHGSPVVLGAVFPMRVR